MNFYQRRDDGKGFRARAIWTLHAAKENGESKCGKAYLHQKYNVLPEDRAIGLQGDVRICRLCFREPKTSVL